MKQNIYLTILISSFLLILISINAIYAQNYPAAPYTEHALKKINQSLNKNMVNLDPTQNPSINGNGLQKKSLANKLNFIRTVYFDAGYDFDKSVINYYYDQKRNPQRFNVPGAFQTSYASTIIFTDTILNTIENSSNLDLEDYFSSELITCLKAMLDERSKEKKKKKNLHNKKLARFLSLIDGEYLFEHNTHRVSTILKIKLLKEEQKLLISLSGRQQSYTCSNCKCNIDNIKVPYTLKERDGFLSIDATLSYEILENTSNLNSFDLNKQNYRIRTNNEKIKEHCSIHFNFKYTKQLGNYNLETESYDEDYYVYRTKVSNKGFCFKYCNYTCNPSDGYYDCEHILEGYYKKLKKEGNEYIIDPNYSDKIIGIVDKF